MSMEVLVFIAGVFVVVGVGLYGVSVVMSRLPRARPFLTAIPLGIGGVLGLIELGSHRSTGVGTAQLLSVILLVVGGLFRIFEKTRPMSATALFAIAFLWIGFWTVASLAR